MSQNTGGGAHIGGNVESGGGSVTGRDAPTQNITLQFDNHSPQEIADIISRLNFTTFGDSAAGIDGLAEKIKLMSQELKQLTLAFEQLRQRVETVVMHQTSTEQELNETKTELAGARKEVADIKKQIAARQETNRSTRYMLYGITAMMLVLLALGLWPIIF